jgi:hypothetical protein
VKIVGDETILRTLNVGFGKSLKKFDVLCIEEKHAMLSNGLLAHISLWF